MYRRSAWSDKAIERRAEYQANLFAAALLMPEPVVRERWKLFRSINYLAPQFPVSKKAIQRRLEELGLIIPSPPGVSFIDLTGWGPGVTSPELPPLTDEDGPIPSFPPIQTNELGMIVAMSDEEWAARSSALDRVFRIAGSKDDGQEGRDDEEVLGLNEP